MKSGTNTIFRMHRFKLSEVARYQGVPYGQVRQAAERGEWCGNVDMAQHRVTDSNGRPVAVEVPDGVAESLLPGNTARSSHGDAFAAGRRAERKVQESLTVQDEDGEVFEAEVVEEGERENSGVPAKRSDSMDAVFRGIEYVGWGALALGAGWLLWEKVLKPDLQRAGVGQPRVQSQGRRGQQAPLLAGMERPGSVHLHVYR